MVIHATAAPRRKPKLTLFQQGENALKIACDDLRIRNLLKEQRAEQLRQWAQEARDRQQLWALFESFSKSDETFEVSCDNDGVM